MKMTVMMLAVVFAVSVISCLQFFRAPEIAGGNPTRLLGNLDYTGLVIGLDMVGTGHGADLYNLDQQLQMQRRLITEGYLDRSLGAGLLYPYPYTPFLAVVLSPLSGLPPLSSLAIWNLLNILGMATGLGYLLKSLPLSRETRAAIFLAGLTCSPFVVNLETGQSSGIMMLSLGVGLALLRKEKDLQGGLVLGLMLFKVQWLPLLALLLLIKWRWRALAGMTATGLTLTAITLLTMGVSWIPGFLLVAGRSQQFDPALALDPFVSQSISGQIALLIAGTMPHDQLISFVRDGVYVTTGLVIILLAALWRGKWQPGSPRWDGAMAIVILGALLTIMHVNHHDVALMVIPFALGLSYIQHSDFSNKVRVAWCVLGAFLYLQSSVLLYANHYNLPIMPVTLVIIAMVVFLSTLLLGKHKIRIATPIQREDKAALRAT